MVEIRPVSETDFRAVVDVVRSVFIEYGFGWEEGDYYADLYDPISHYPAPGGFWVAVCDGTVVGTVGLEVFSPVPSLPPSLNGVATMPHVTGFPTHATLFEGKMRVAGADCSLERLYLNKECRGRGVGHALFQTALEAARTQGCKRMEIWSDKLLVSAHALYGRSGATLVADRRCDDPDESPEWGLCLQL
ncbi:MAG: GNAT family N-acetyltransferase [Fimbriimonadaceae bacterium]